MFIVVYLGGFFDWEVIGGFIYVNLGTGLEVLWRVFFCFFFYWGKFVLISWDFIWMFLVMRWGVIDLGITIIFFWMGNRIRICEEMCRECVYIRNFFLLFRFVLYIYYLKREILEFFMWENWGLEMLGLYLVIGRGGI